MNRQARSQLSDTPVKTLLGRWRRWAAQARASDRLERISFHYPLTVSGTVLLALALFLLGRAFAAQNPYGFLLSASALVFLVVVAAAARLQASRLNTSGAEWDSSTPLFARNSSGEHTLLLDGTRAWPFFRVHFILSGVMKIGRNATVYPRREVSTRGGHVLRFPLCLPLSGQFDAKARFEIRDVFGLARAGFGERHERRLAVRPALLAERRFPDVEALDGLEEKSKIKQSDIERYFMREYIPGDRIRDINWKASSRISELVTRIAPVTQEKTRVLSVICRPFRGRRVESPVSVAHLNFLKSWMFLFLKSVKKDRPEYQFRITIGDDVMLLETEEDVEAFGVELSGLFFRSPPPDRGIDAVAGLSGEAFVFTTPYDDALPVFLRALSGSNVYIFRTTVPSRNDDRRTIRLFSLSDPVVFSSSWLLNWERGLKNPPVPAEHSRLLEEEPLEVRLA